MKTRIMKYGVNGEGIAYVKHKPVFVPLCIKDEIIDLEITEMNERYGRGTVRKIIEKSPQRIKAICPYQKECGSCVMMHMNEEEQNQAKKEILQEALQKYADYKREVPDLVRTNDLFYRNKCSLAFGLSHGKLVNVMYQNGSHKNVYIDECVIHEKGLETIRKEILKILNEHHCGLYDKKNSKGYRYLMIRGLDKEYQVVLVTGKDEIPATIIDEITKIRGVVSLHQGINTERNPLNMIPENLHLLKGKEAIGFELQGFKLQLKPSSFFQLNTKTAEMLYETVISEAGEKNDLVVEAYSGIGVMGLLLSRKAKKAICIDIGESSIRDGQMIMEENHISNVEYRCEDASKALRKILKRQQIGCLVVDPPRVGLSKDLLQTLNSHPVDKIIYVSCNPATLAKDLDVLKKKYEIEKILPFDMFSQTQHIETVCCLYHRKNDFVSVPYEPKDADYLKK
ncbi:MAG: 23S rRNA (uracil(1939)-C(5))-methyltransferase RlmD [Erysipelotrichaceae bacterium]|nr:23S rRNA (uracil(1939)-C(5))-methyltransferase RlmD [Erysipelotrichaceae bacterium]